MIHIEEKEFSRERKIFLQKLVSRMHVGGPGQHFFIGSEPDLLEGAFAQLHRLTLGGQDYDAPKARHQQFVERHHLHEFTVEVKP